MGAHLGRDLEVSAELVEIAGCVVGVRQDLAQPPKALPVAAPNPAGPQLHTRLSQRVRRTLPDHGRDARPCPADAGADQGEALMSDTLLGQVLPDMPDKLAAAE